MELVTSRPTATTVLSWGFLAHVPISEHAFLLEYLRTGSLQ